jgi:hypothetical protein
MRRRGSQWYGNLLLGDYGILIFLSIFRGIEIFRPTLCQVFPGRCIDIREPGC